VRHADARGAAGRGGASVAKFAEGSSEERWVSKQLAVLSAQRAAASERRDLWVQERHRWHEARLGELLELFMAGAVTSLPDSVREDVEFYATQLADGNDAAQESFYFDEEIYGDLLSAKRAAGALPYTRPAETEEAEAVVEQLGRWSNVTQQGMDSFARLVKRHADSAGVAERAAARISALAADHKEQAGSLATRGLAPKPMLALVADAMRRFPYDPKVQVQGCAAVLSLARHSGKGGAFTVLQGGGAKLWVEALQNNIMNPEVALIATRAFSYMTGPRGVVANTPEWAFLCASGAEEVLQEVLPYHLNDPRIDKAARTTIPFLRG